MFSLPIGLWYILIFVIFIGRNHRRRPIFLLSMTILIFSTTKCTCQNIEIDDDDDDEKNLMPKYLNVGCDFESIPGGGCHLRESYCSLHTCICKPDFPINIADRLCIAKYKSVGEICTFSQECQTGSFCGGNGDIGNRIPGTNSNNKVCHCKTGYVYSEKTKKCVRGLKGASCSRDSDCHGDHLFCSLIMCECKYGYEWLPTEESCLKRSKFGEQCETSINCKVYDEFSECDPYTRKCVCGQFLSRRYTLDEVTHRCVSCPLHRYNTTSNTCLPKKITVEYGLLDQSSSQKNSHQYVYVALSMAPFVVFALIGFIYRYVNPYGTLADNIIIDQTVTVLEPSNAFDDTTGTYHCLPIGDPENNNINNENATTSGDTATQQTCLLIPEPPPPYDMASQDLPPSYDEVIAQQNDRYSTQR